MVERGNPIKARRKNADRVQNIAKSMIEEILGFREGRDRDAAGLSSNGIFRDFRRLRRLEVWAERHAMRLHAQVHGVEITLQSGPVRINAGS